jgi:hypothetical protein
MSELLSPDCVVPDRYLVDLAYGETSNVPPEVQSHIAGCARCTRMLGELREVRGAFSALPLEEPSTDLDARVLRALDASLAGEDLSRHTHLPEPELALGAKRLAARISLVSAARADRPSTPAPTRSTTPLAESATFEDEERARPVRARRRWLVIGGPVLAAAAVVTIYLASDHRSLLEEQQTKSLALAAQASAPAVALKKAERAAADEKVEAKKAERAAADEKAAEGRALADALRQAPPPAAAPQAPPPPSTLPSPTRRARKDLPADAPDDPGGGNAFRDKQDQKHASGANALSAPAPVLQRILNDSAAASHLDVPAPASAPEARPPPPSVPAASVAAPSAPMAEKRESVGAPRVENEAALTPMALDSADAEQAPGPGWSGQLEIARAAVARGDHRTAAAAFGKVLSAADVPQDVVLESMTGRWRALLALGRLDEAQAAAKVLERRFPGRTNAVAQTMEARAKSLPATPAPSEAAKPAEPAVEPSAIDAH